MLSVVSKYVSDYFWVDEDGFVTVSKRLSLEARARTGGNFDHPSIMAVLFEFCGGDAAYDYERAAIETVDTIRASSRAEATAYFDQADINTLMHLRPLGLPSSISEMENQGLFDEHKRYRRRKNGRN